MKLHLVVFVYLACCGLSPSLIAQEFIPSGAAYFEAGTIILTPDSANCVGGAHVRKSDGSILSIDLTKGFVLQAANLTFGDSDLDGGHGLVIFLTSDSIFHNPASFIPKGTGDTLGYYLELSKALGFEFDTHIAQDSAFHDYRTDEDHFALISEDITAPPLFGPVSLLHKRQDHDVVTNVETGSSIRLEITWDPEEQLLEVCTNRALRMSYHIDLIAYFGGNANIYPGVVAATGEVHNRQTISLTGIGWSGRQDPRPINDCDAVKRLPNWIITNNPDYAYWDIKEDEDKVRQKDNGSPSFLASPIKLIDVRMQGTIKVLDTMDNDWIGVGWGMKAPFGQTYDIFDGFLLDFKKADQYWCDDMILAREGFTTAKLAGYIDPNCSSFISHDSTAAYQVIDRQYGAGEGWEAGEEYKFTVEYTGHYFETWVTEVSSGDTLYHIFHENLSDTLFQPGRFAFYNNSQKGAVYADFDYQYLHRFKASNYSPFTNEPVTFSYDFFPSNLAETITGMHYKIGEDFTADAINDDTVATIQHTFTVPGTYPVSLCLVDAAGCEHLFTDTLYVRAEPITILPVDTVLCPGAVLLLSTPFTDAEVTWQDSIEFPSFVVTEAGEYWVRIRDGEYLQYDTITVRYADTIQYALDVQTSCHQQDNGQVLVNVLQATPPFEVELEGIAGVQHDNLLPGVYQLTVEDRYGCTVEQGLEVLESCAPTYNVQIDSTSCWGWSDGLITLSDEDCPLSFLLNGEEFNHVGWFDGLEAGAYTITAIDSIGCRWDTTLTVPTPPPFTANIIPADTIIYLGACAPLHVQLSYGDSAQIAWTPLTSLSCGGCLQTLAIPQQDQVYSIDIVNSKGCKASATSQVRIDPDKNLYWPNVFSPNGDGYNDYFYPQAGEKRKGVKEVVYLRIFDRSGSMVFEREMFAPDDPLLGWDGTFKGEQAAIGVYTVIAEWLFIDTTREFHKGDLSLKR